MYLTSLTISFIGLAVYLTHLNPVFDKSRLWKRQTGKAYVMEMWNDPVLWIKASKTKDEDRAVWFSVIHPTYHTPRVVEAWVCMELVAKYVHSQAAEGAEGVVVVARPEWLNREFADISASLRSFGGVMRRRWRGSGLHWGYLCR